MLICVKANFSVLRQEEGGSQISDPFLNYLALFLLLLVCAVVLYAIIDLLRFVKKSGPEDERNRRAELHRVWAIASVTAKLHHSARRDNVVCL